MAFHRDKRRFRIERIYKLSRVEEIPRIAFEYEHSNDWFDGITEKVR